MSDNVAISAGVGTSIATDDCAGVQYQFVKLADGTLDSTTKSKITTSAASSSDPGLVTRPIPFSGYTPYHLRSAATTNATSLKASAGTVGMVTASNINASPRYLKFYDKASAPNPAADTVKQCYLIPGNTTGSGTNIPIPERGLAFGTGIAFAIVTGESDTDNTAVAAGDIHVNIAYV